MGTQAVVVHTGPLWEEQLLQGMLDEEGIQAFIPDESTKRVDPFSTGANPLGTNLVVAQADAERAAALISKHRKVAEKRDADVPAHHPPTETEQLATLGRRVRWSCVLVVTAPLALWWGVQYLWGLRGGVARPRQHGMTVAAIFVALIFVFALVVLLVAPWPWARHYFK